jgi:NADH dehydrogenase [ubiquinone] 1 alpha subcomplex assembly factor 1
MSSRGAPASVRLPLYTAKHIRTGATHANPVAALKLEAVKGPQAPRPLYDFNSHDNVSSCILMSDALIGGFSKSNLDLVTPASSSSPSNSTTSPPSSYARFHGTISTALPADKPKVHRTGYAGFRTPDQSPTLFGRAFWDIDPYTYLALRIKSDGRSYFINVQTEGVEPTDLHQHRLFAKSRGQWETVLVRWNDFVRTNFGFVVEPQTELLRQKVTTVGIGLTDRVEGPFELCIERMWATNTVDEGPSVAGEDGSAPEEGAGLKNRKGEKIHW